jgi:hypothetical protein
VRGALADLRHALRVYARTPIASMSTVLALAVTMAFLSAFLSLWNDLALQPHPGFEDSDRLVTVAMSDGDTMAGTSIALMEDISENVNLVEGVATDQRYFADVIIDGERVQVPSETVVRRYFPVLRPRMKIGRGFEPADHEPEAEPVVVLSYAFWQRHFGARPNVIGESLDLEMRSSGALFTPGGGGLILTRPNQPETKVYAHRIVGVLAPGMKGTFQPATELYFPFEPMSSIQFSGAEGDAPSMAEIYEFTSGLTGVGRLAPGATVEALQAELDRRYSADDYPLIANRASQGMRLTAIAGVHLDLKARREGLKQVNLFLAGTLVLALVAGCNTSLFLLSRAPGRRRELAIRTSLGATRWRLTRQLVNEATLLVVPAAVLGLLVSLWLVVAMRDLTLYQTVRWRDVSPIDWRVLVMLSALTLMMLAMVSAAPALGLRRLEVGAAARTVQARAGWGQKLAGAAQLVAALVLGSIAVAFGSELVGYLTADPGFEMDDVIVVRAPPVDFMRLTSREDFVAVQLEERRRQEVLSSLPGIAAVSFSSTVPGELQAGGMRQTRSQIAPGSTLPGGDEQVEINLFEVQPNFPEFLGLRFVQGGTFVGDNPTGVIVNETAARLLWGRTDVVGEPIGLFRGQQSGVEVIGVLRDVYFGHPRDGLAPMVMLGSGSGSGEMLLRTSSSPAALRRLLEERIESGDLEITLGRIDRLSTVWRTMFATDIARLLLTGSATVITVLLAAFGAYGTQRFVVAAGRREYAIRAALGASPAAIGRLVVRRGLLMSLPAIVAGTLLAYITVATMRDGYFSNSTSPLIVTLMTALFVLALVAAAVYAPAAQARRIAPAPLLRED